MDWSDKWNTSGSRASPDTICGVLTVVKNCCKLFADDAKLYQAVKTEMDNASLQGEVISLTAWPEDWQLPFNECKCLHIG